MNSLSQKTLIICGIVRNAEKPLKRNIPIVDELCTYFNDYRIIVYENDSTDGTKQVLSEWHKKDPKRIHVSLNICNEPLTIPRNNPPSGVNRFFCHSRISKMVSLRNRYMDYIDQQGWSADYLMVIDLDVAQLFLNTILDTLNNEREWDAITAYGYSLSPTFKRRYHDTYALTTWENFNIPQTEDIILRKNHQFDKYTTSDDWISVASAFGGMAIYRYEAVKNLRYHIVKNDDSDVEVRCEHFSIYKQMIERGYNKFYVVPSMTLLYQELSSKVVLQRILLKCDIIKNLFNPNVVRVLVVATSRKTRGGITAVIKAHETGIQWKQYHCHWVQTHKDDNIRLKIFYFIRAIIDYFFRLPFCDIVHVHFSHIVSVRRKMIFVWMAKMCGKKLIIHFHAFDIETTIAGKYKKIYKKLFESADKVIVLSGWWKNNVQKLLSISDDKLLVIYNPCPNVNITDNLNKSNYILYAGSVIPRKGYGDLITAFAKIAHKYNDWKIVFAGNGEIEKGEQLAISLGIASQVEFKGWVLGEAKDRIFREATIFCLPSYAEGFSMAVLDAWAYGLPVITTPVGGIPDVAKDGENMLLFNPGDVDLLSKHLEQLIVNESLRNQIADASKDFAKTEFNIKTINRQVSNLYAELSTKN